jgi:hypothetical protein
MKASRFFCVVVVAVTLSGCASNQDPEGKAPTDGSATAAVTERAGLGYLAR